MYIVKKLLKTTNTSMWTSHLYFNPFRSCSELNLRSDICISCQDSCQHLSLYILTHQTTPTFRIMQHILQMSSAQKLLTTKSRKSQVSYNLRSCTLTMTGGVLSTHCCILRSGHSFGASGRLCVCTSAGRGHAAQVGAHIEAQRLLHPPAKARSQPGNFDCSSTHSEPQPCEHPHLCAVRSHNQRLGKQKGINTEMSRH